MTLETFLENLLNTYWLVKKISKRNKATKYLNFDYKSYQFRKIINAISLPFRRTIDKTIFYLSEKFVIRIFKIHGASVGNKSIKNNILMYIYNIF